MDARPEVPKLPECRGMERRRRHTAMPESGQPSSHLACSLVGERDDENVARPDDARRERIRDPARDHPGLATARAGQDAERPAGRDDCLALSRIEVVQEVVGIRQWHAAILARATYLPVIG